MMRRNIVRLAERPGEIYYAKRFDYKAEKIGNHYVAYRRQLENDPWRLYCTFVVVDGILFTNWVDNIKTIEEENERVKEFSAEEKALFKKQINRKADIREQGFYSEGKTLEKGVDKNGKEKKKAKRAVT